VELSPVIEQNPTIGYRKFNLNKGFRSQTVGNVRGFCRLVKDAVYPYMRMKRRHNTVYADEDFLDMLTHTAMTHDFTQNGSRTFQLQRPEKTPSSKTVLYHIGKFGSKELLERFDGAFEKIFEIAKSYGVFKNAVDLAIDFTDMPYYGDKNDTMIMGGKKHKGTHFSYRFITLNIVVDGLRFTIMALPRSAFTTDEKLVRKLLICAKEHVMIRYVFLDRGFFNSKIINTLQDLDVKFLMPATANPKVKELAVKGDMPAIHDYVMKGHQKHYAKFKLVVAEDDKGLVGAFATNIDVETGREADLFTLYGKRWGIETSYRVKVDFRPRTTSRNYAVRLFYFLFSTCLYNLWVLANMFLGAIAGKFFTRPVITAKMFGIMLYTFHYWDDGG
jgi:putative transposase